MKDELGMTNPGARTQGKYDECCVSRFNLSSLVVQL